jgi:NAD(P) transhydrogenase subunit alpha
VIVDLAVERGGNVEGAEPGRVVTTTNGVKIVGHLNVPGRIAASASLLYARNLFAFLETLVDKTTKTLAVNRGDDLVKATMLTDGGKVVHPAFAKSDQQPHVEPAAIPATTLVAEAPGQSATDQAATDQAATDPAATAPVVSQSAAPTPKGTA